jgi:hypothetical protein
VLVTGSIFILLPQSGYEFGSAGMEIERTLSLAKRKTSIEMELEPLSLVLILIQLNLLTHNEPLSAV